MILAATYHGILAFFFAVVGILLMGVILLQRGKGVGLSGAFGGTGGHTTFGAKTGDFLMWVTVAGAGFMLAFAIILNYVFVPSSATLGVTAPAPAPAAPAPGAPSPGAPALPAPRPSGAPVGPMSPAPSMPPAAPSRTPGAPAPVNPAPSPAPQPAAPSPAGAPAPGTPTAPPGGGTPPGESSPTPGPVSEANTWHIPGTHGGAVAPPAIFGEAA